MSNINEPKEIEEITIEILSDKGIDVDSIILMLDAAEPIEVSILLLTGKISPELERLMEYLEFVYEDYYIYTKPEETSDAEFIITQKGRLIKNKHYQIIQGA